MSAPKLRVVSAEEADQAARERLICEALRLAKKFSDHKLRGHKTINVGAGDALLDAAKELLP